MLKTKFALTALALSVTPMAFAAKPAPAVAAPFGITIGATTCNEAEKVLGAKGVKVPDSDWSVKATQPSSLYPGAQNIEAVCVSAAEPVILLKMKASKGGMGNPGPRDAYQTLASKYKLAAGGPIPNVGNGYARFNDGASNVIEIDAPHMSFEFTAYYMTKAVYELLVQRVKDKNAAQQGQKGAL